ncbi:MAG: hydrogenase expression protein HupH [Gammaproteobacteria bacterium]|nr:hydrogenase expression protein HupH [Gammaproteobacteria bacterium]
MTVTQTVLRIRVINPTISNEWNEEMASFLDDPGIILEPVALDYGTASIESRVDDELAVPGIIEQAILAEQSGADGVVVNCMDDPGLHAAREAVRIPVSAPGEAGMHLASMLGHRFAIVTTSEEDIPMVEELIARNGLSDSAGPVRALGLPVLELVTDPGATLDAFVAASAAAVFEDGAGVIIPGCSLLSSMAGIAARMLAERGAAVPVLNPLLVAIRQIETMIRLGVTHSRRSYPPPVAKPLEWHDPSMELGPRLESGRT